MRNRSRPSTCHVSRPNEAQHSIDHQVCSSHRRMEVGGDRGSQGNGKVTYRAGLDNRKKFALVLDLGRKQA
jgi:hypothetical protein